MARNSSVPDDDVRAVLGELLRHQELNVDLGLSACKHLNSNGRYEICEFGLKELLSRFAGSRHVGRVYAQRLQAAIHRLPMQDSIDYTDKFFDDNDVINTLDEASHKSIQLLLWEQAAKCHETGKMECCVTWYDQSLRLFLHGRSVGEAKLDEERSANIGKLHRNRAACFLSLGRFGRAEEAARDALAFDAANVFSHFTCFKASVAQGNETEAIEAIGRLMSTDAKDDPALPSSGNKIDTRHALICLAAQHALEKGQRDVAVTTLRHLASSGKHDLAKLTAHRCLVRLLLTMVEGSEENPSEASKDTVDAHAQKDEDMDVDSPSSHHPKDRDSLMKSAIESVKEAFKVLEHLSDSFPQASKADCLPLPGNESHVLGRDEFNSEVTWFMKITWNMALQFNNEPVTMMQLFYLCKEFLGLVDPDECVLLRQKTCVLMCAACGLAVARRANSRNDSNTQLEQVLQTLEQCRVICSRLAAIQSDQDPRKDDKSAVLMALYQFEAMAKLSKCTHKGEPPELQDLFDQITKLSQAECKTFETIAALSMESPARHPHICKQSLKIALKTLNRQMTLENDGADRDALFKKRSSLYRMLIDTCLNEGSSSDPSNSDECWMYFNEVHHTMLNEANTISDLDSLWFTVRCWNVGVRLFTSSHVVEAERWCALALRLLTQLERYKESYESHMNLVYREILAKKDFSQIRVAAKP